MPSDHTVASVSEPTPLPPRPTLYALVTPPSNFGDRWWKASELQVNPNYWDNCSIPPNSVLVTIPGSTPPSPIKPASEEPKPATIPWPDDLSTLVGKRITARYRPNCAPETKLVESYGGPDVLYMEKDRPDQEFHAWNPSLRDLLSIEDVAPATKPATVEGEEWEWVTSKCPCGCGVGHSWPVRKTPPPDLAQPAPKPSGTESEVCACEHSKEEHVNSSGGCTHETHEGYAHCGCDRFRPKPPSPATATEEETLERRYRIVCKTADNLCRRLREMEQALASERERRERAERKLAESAYIAQDNGTNKYAVYVVRKMTA